MSMSTPSYTVAVYDFKAQSASCRLLPLSGTSIYFLHCGARSQHPRLGVQLAELPNSQRDEEVAMLVPWSDFCPFPASMADFSVVKLGRGPTLTRMPI